MADKTISTRIIQKHDTTDNWNKATNFVPKLGELILYTDVNKIKMGDGVTNVIQLPFLSADVELDRPTVVEALGFMPPAEDTDTHRPIQMNGTQILGDNKDPLNLKAGTNVSLSNNSGTVTINATDTKDLSSMTGILPMTLGGTGRSWSSTGSTAGENLPPKNAIIKMYNEDNPSRMSSVATSSGAFYATGDNASPQFGILPMAQGGSGTTFASANANAIVRVSSNQNQLYYTNVGKGAAYATAADSELSFGNLSLNLGGTGRDFTTSTFANGIVKMPTTIGSGESLKAVQTKSGALFATSTNGEPQFDTLPLAQGGTGRNISSYPGNAIIRMSSDPDTYPYVMYTPTSSGAFYATAENGGAKFGTLPLAQGGTGTVFSSATSGDIVYYYKKDENSTPQLWTKSKLDIAHGGTNGTTAAEARTNLGVNRIFSGTGAPGSSTGSTGDIYIRYTA